MEIGSWTQSDDDRRCFVATPVLDGPMFDAWIGPLGKRAEFKEAARNPIMYWPFKSGSSS